MNACIGVGRLDEAAALLDAAVAAGVRLDARAYNVLLKGHARAGDPSALAGIMEQMQRAQARVMPFDCSLACWHAGKWRAPHDIGRLSHCSGKLRVLSHDRALYSILL